MFSESKVPGQKDRRRQIAQHHPSLLLLPHPALLLPSRPSLVTRRSTTNKPVSTHCRTTHIYRLRTKKIGQVDGGTENTQSRSTKENLRKSIIHLVVFCKSIYTAAATAVLTAVTLGFCAPGTDFVSLATLYQVQKIVTELYRFRVPCHHGATHFLAPDKKTAASVSTTVCPSVGLS